jgi:hypothetical protein
MQGDFALAYFAKCVFLSAFLLFQVEPMIGKLPSLAGAHLVNWIYIIRDPGCLWDDHDPAKPDGGPTSCTDLTRSC